MLIARPLMVVNPALFASQLYFDSQVGKEAGEDLGKASPRMLTLQFIISQGGVVQIDLHTLGAMCCDNLP